MKQNKTKSKINPASLLKNQSNPLKKTAKAILFFFSKNHHHMNMIKMTGLKICNTTRESKREKSKSWPLPIENSLLHNTYHQIHMTQGAIFLFFKNEMLFFH